MRTPGFHSGSRVFFCFADLSLFPHAHPTAHDAHHPGRAHADHPDSHLPFPSDHLRYIQQHNAQYRHVDAQHKQKKLHRHADKHNHHASDGKQAAQMPSYVQGASAHAHPSSGISYAAQLADNTKALQTFV
jgi:hypothetical protein